MLNPRDVAELEAKYYKYILKNRLKLSIFFLSIFFLFFSIFFYFFQYKNISLIKYDKNIDKNSSSITKLNIKNGKSRSLLKIEDKNSTKKIGSLEKKIQNEKKFIFKIIGNKNIFVNHKSKETLKFKMRKIKKRYVSQANVTKVPLKNDLFIQKKAQNHDFEIITRDITTFSYLKDKFKQTNDIIFALMLCEKYYSHKKFKKSLKWSIIANDLDSSNEKSWIWFAKSKYRLNQKADAIRALESFLKSNDSKKVKYLLRDMNNGDLDD